MDVETLHKLSKEYSEKGLYHGAFESLSITIYRQIDFANNVLLLESDTNIEDEAFVIYSIHEEASRCLYWSTESANKYIQAIKPCRFPTEDFLALYKTHFRGSKIFNNINIKKLDSIYSLSTPAHDDWSGEFFIKADDKQYVLMWNYGD